MKTNILITKLSGFIVMLLFSVVLTGCSTDVPKLLEEGKAAFYNSNYTEAKKAFLKCANIGDSQGQFWLAYLTCYTNGHYSNTDTLSEEDADKYILDLCKQSADQNDGDGYFLMACLYYQGRGVHQDENKYKEYIDKSVELNSAWGKAEKGWMLIKGSEDDIKTGVVLIKESAETGNYQGKGFLGACYCDGIGVEEDINKGIELLKDAGNHHITNAYDVLARIYYFGLKNIPKDYEKAFKYANNGRITGENLYILACCYYLGKGTNKDEGHGAALARESAKLGFVLGQSMWAILCEDGYGTKEEAFENYKKAADQGDVESIAKVGEFLLKGTAGKTDYATAKQYLIKASSNGSELAQELLSSYDFILSLY